MTRHWLVGAGRLGLLLLGCAGVGFALNHLPPARAVGTFWWGNSAWPYIALPLLCGTLLARDRVLAAVVGAASVTAMVVGFYAQQLLNERAVERRLGVPLHGLSWFLHVPWLYYGLVVGAACGVWGAVLRRRKVIRLVGLLAVAEALALALKVEGHISYLPMLWHSPPTPFGWTGRNLVGWGVEFVAGVSLIWFGRPAGDVEPGRG